MLNFLASPKAVGLLLAHVVTKGRAQWHKSSCVLIFKGGNFKFLLFFLMQSKWLERNITGVFRGLSESFLDKSV